MTKAKAKTMPMKVDETEGCWGKWAMGKSKNTGTDWEIEVFRVGPDTKGEGALDDGLADGWYWFCLADYERGVYEGDPSPHAGVRGPFNSEADAVTDANGMGVK